MTPLVWLFDVDGTMIRTYGVAREAFSAAAEAVLGVEDAMQDLVLAGRLDPSILGSVLERHGLDLTAAERARFWEIARNRMESALKAGRGHVLPGVTELLTAVAREPGWTSALLTGNTAAMARVKLGHFGLLDWFSFGAFGDEAADRDELACVAVGRAQDLCGAPPEACIVVGDTQHDVRCARAAGAWAVAVATGMTSREELEPLGPDLLLDDLRDTEGILGWARGLRRSSSRTAAPRPAG